TSSRELRSRHRRLELLHEGVVALHSRAHVIERGAADKTRLEQRFLTLEVGRGELAGHHRLAQLFFDALDLRCALAGFQVLETRERALELSLRLLARGELVFALALKPRRDAVNRLPALHRN